MSTESDLQREPTIFSSMLICFFLTVQLFVALVFRQRELALLSVLILLVMGISKAWSVLSISRVFCHLETDKRRLFPGESLLLTTRIVNAKLLPVWIQVVWPQTRLLENRDDGRNTPREAGLLWYQQTTFGHPLTAVKRGCCRMGPSNIRTGDLFGFFHSEKQQSERLEIVVYPRLIALKPIALPKRDLFGTPGGQSPVKDPVYINGIREYRPAGPARYIHWKASARHLKLQEKIFEPSEQGKIILALDVSSFEKNEAADEFETTLEVMASLCLQLDQTGLAVGLITNGTLEGADVASVPAGRGAHRLSAILEILGRVQMKSRGPLLPMVSLIPGPQRFATWACFCFQNDGATDAMRARCGSGSMRFALFAWHLNASGHGLRHVKPPHTHLIRTLILPDAADTRGG
ncbi:MAG: DUF58 domain-containing protein [Deltaproteobacteria bacterium]|nr:DUF58 domain-containing protein [Deltaproteobacteria bacterium]